MELFSAADVMWSMVRVWSVGPGRAADGVPVLVRAHPEFDKSFFYTGKLDVVGVTGYGVEFVAFRVPVSVVVSDEVESVEGAQWSEYAHPMGRFRRCRWVEARRSRRGRVVCVYGSNSLPTTQPHKSSQLNQARRGEKTRGVSGGRHMHIRICWSLCIGDSRSYACIHV